MKGTSKVIMGATLVMVVSLAIVLGLVLVLLIELYCSLLLRRRKLRNTTTSTSNTTTTATATTTITNNASSLLPLQSSNQSATTSPLSTFYSHGVLDAPPRNFLFPAVSSSSPLKENRTTTKNHQQSFQLHRVLKIHAQESNTTSPHHLGIISPSSPSTSFVPSSPQPFLQVVNTSITNEEKEEEEEAYFNGDGKREHYVYISNPIYDNDDAYRLSIEDTPFETPDTSPSRLETGSSGSSSSSGEEEEREREIVQVITTTPPLTPMKKLPTEASSVSLKDARSLGTSGSDDTVSNNAGSGSSSSLGSPRTSPSW